MQDDPSAHWTDLRALDRALRALGVDVRAQLAGLGLPSLDEPRAPSLDNARFEEAWGAVWQAAFSARPEPWLPLRVGLTVPFGAYEVVDYLSSHAPTFGECVAQLVRYFRLITRVVQMSLDLTDTSRPALRIGADPSPEGAVALLYTLGVTVAHWAAVLGDAPRMLRLELPGPDATGCPLEGYADVVVLGANEARLEFSHRTWQVALPNATPGLAAVLERHASDLLARRGLDVSPLAPIRAALAAALESGEARVEGVARRLALSPRTLHRRLADHGTTWQVLVDDHRREVACRLLRDPRRSVGEIAWFLGYSEQTAFLRAFRRWTGLTPSRFRNGG